MEETDLGSLRPGERGAALILVLIALAMLLPLALLVSGLAISRQRESTRWRETVARQYAVHGAFENVRARLRAGQIQLAPEGRAQFELTVGVPISVRIVREPDAVLTLGGDVLRGAAVRSVDLKQKGIAADGRLVRQFHRLEIYLAETEAAGGPVFPAVRLLGGLARLEDGTVVSLGYRIDRG